MQLWEARAALSDSLLRLRYTATGSKVEAIMEKGTYV
jgi:hypothetical protein